MATTLLTIKGGQIINYCDRYFEFLSENGKKYRGNGWTVTIKDGRKDRPGRIICHAERLYSDGPAICHREFKLADGTVGLAGGNIYSRYAYFRSRNFQKFLDKFGITAVKRENPNKEFEFFTGYDARGSAGGNVWTDGDVQWFTDVEYGDPGKGESPSCYEGYMRCTVSNATWAIVMTDMDWGNDHSYSAILYTTVKNAMSLEEPMMAHPELGPRTVRRERKNLM